MPWAIFIDDPLFGKAGIQRIEDLSKRRDKHFDLSPEESFELQSIQSTERKKQWLAVRYALHDLSGAPKRLRIQKDNYGKPFFMESKKSCSLSHTREHVAVLMHQKECGIDIERKREQIINIAPRFLSEDEMNTIPENDTIKYSTLYWSSKEACYKAFGKKELDFRKEIKIDEFEIQNELFVSKASIIKNGKEFKYNIMAIEFDENIMAIAVKK